MIGHLSHEYCYKCHTPSDTPAIMATPVGELSYGAIEINHQETLAISAYGIICKAKWGQLPCAAKLLHDSIFGIQIPKLEQECGFLKRIKHPNIVQYLGTVRDPQSQRLSLLMELMDESLTRFLEQSTGPLPYHTQLNICHDVALALAYLHSNDIIHRYLSSNNVLLIGEGSRAKVTNFSMATRLETNISPQTMCPGLPAYMPPEAFNEPSYYCQKLDCFSHGVLTIQIATREFPDPGERYYDPDGNRRLPIPEIKRRQNHIDLVEPDHSLLPLALHCLEDSDRARISAEELCGRLARLKEGQSYLHSVEQTKEFRQNMSPSLQQRIQEKDSEMAKTRATFETELESYRAQLQSMTEKYESLVRRTSSRLQLPRVPKLLRREDTAAICRCLYSLRTRWKTIGTFLCVDQNSLEAVKMDNESSDDRLVALVGVWLRQTTPPPTWQALAEAVEYVDPTKAQEIRKKFVN